MQEPISIQQPEDWQSQLRNVITRADELLEMLGLRPGEVGYSDEAARGFALKVPRAFARRMQRGDPRDPLLLQVMANARELDTVPGYHRDPVGETGEANTQPGVIRKYRGRALLLVSGGCAVNCRYCFRRHFPYGENQNSRADWSSALSQLATDPDMDEIILSGGDPLLATDGQLMALVEQIAAIPQVRRLRVHSRLPVVIPERVTDSLLNALTRPELQTVMVLHVNHGNEIDESVEASVKAMRHRDMTVLNQAVLLAGVNDSADALVELSQRLFAAGILPYYLHVLDKVQGAAHFDLPGVRARQLMDTVTARLPGYLVPRLVREVEGAASKIGLSLDIGSC
jgi:EF-P beta-lysylation protein EpmB